MNITDQAIEAAAKAIQEEWGITPFGELSYQAERALREDAKAAILLLAKCALEASA
ncbi:hypothetical protein ACFC25_04240 [Pseudarthrobacter sp. NPDC055928]|uniref:hypothetical protein n=1 Tax=Pseudarthrobacter sp. NPDC055928 TaxID=3345661 RepID=UPI0035DF7CDE